MEFHISTKKINQITADCEIILVSNKNLKHKWIKDLKDLNTLDFQGNEEEVVFLPHQHRVYAGCKELNHDNIRLAVSGALKAIKKTKYKSIKIGSYCANKKQTNISAIVEGFVLGSYIFDMYKSKKDKNSIKNITISTENYGRLKVEGKELRKELNFAKIVANATNFSKDIANQAPDDMTPVAMAKLGKKLSAEIENVTCFAGSEKFLEKEKMGAFLAVSRASEHAPRLIHLKYKPKNAKKKITFVGKGLTYDSGGLSLKPGSAMTTMKSDKSGGAAVMGILKAAAELKLPFEIHAIIGATENMIGGNAYKPDDVLVARNGKTIEVKNTDAEGRLVLADCLSYAQDLKPDYIFDLATLTGACVVALGEYTSGIMGHDKSLKRSMENAAEKSGELSSPLPFNRYLAKLLKSSVADISNISSSRYGGAITAALFLDNFIEEENKDKWLHLDIAGPAYVESDWGYNQAGASGAGVRMSLYWLQELKNRI